MWALVTAGGTEGDGERLCAGAGNLPKVLLPVAGRPMVQWVLDAVAGTPAVHAVMVAGFATPPADSGGGGLHSPLPVHYLADAGDLTANLVGGMRQIAGLDPLADWVLVVSADVPAVQPAHLEWLAEQVSTTAPGTVDAYYGIVRRQVMDARFPGAGRTYARLRGVEACGADVHGLRMSAVLGHERTWQRMLDARKNRFRQARLIGFGTLVLGALGRLTLADMEQRASRAFGFRCRVLEWPWAETAMDADNREQYELLDIDLRPR